MFRIIQVPLILLIGWLIGGTWFWVCEVRCECGESKAVTSTKGEGEAPTETDPMVLFSQGVSFAMDGGNGELDEHASQYLSELAETLKQNPQKQLQIVGLYHRNENSGEQNLGLRRAIFLSDKLEAMGVPHNQLIRLPKKLNQALAGNAFSGGLELELLDVPMEEQEKEAPTALPDNKSFRFGYNQAGIELSDEERTYISQVLQYLRSHSLAKLQLTGHTDDVGEPDNNLKLGQERAETVKSYFEAFGLDSGRIVAGSKGESAPIATNSTTEGRQMNRRVEVSIVPGS